MSKAKDLVGQRLTIEVKDTPCRCIFPGCEPLTETTTGKIRGWKSMPAGHVGFLERDDGVVICFDADLDIKAGKIELVQFVH